MLLSGGKLSNFCPVVRLSRELGAPPLPATHLSVGERKVISWNSRITVEIAISCRAKSDQASLGHTAVRYRELKRPGADRHRALSVEPGRFSSLYRINVAWFDLAFDLKNYSNELRTAARYIPQ